MSRPNGSVGDWRSPDAAAAQRRGHGRQATCLLYVTVCFEQHRYWPCYFLTKFHLASTNLSALYTALVLDLVCRVAPWLIFSGYMNYFLFFSESKFSDFSGFLKHEDYLHGGLLEGRGSSGSNTSNEVEIRKYHKVTFYVGCACLVYCVLLTLSYHAYVAAKYGFLRRKHWTIVLERYCCYQILHPLVNVLDMEAVLAWFLRKVFFVYAVVISSVSLVGFVYHRPVVASLSRHGSVVQRFLLVECLTRYWLGFAVVLLIAVVDRSDRAGEERLAHNYGSFVRFNVVYCLFHLILVVVASGVLLNVSYCSAFRMKSSWFDYAHRAHWYITKYGSWDQRKFHELRSKAVHFSKKRVRRRLSSFSATSSNLARLTNGAKRVALADRTKSAAMQGGAVGDRSVKRKAAQAVTKLLTGQVFDVANVVQGDFDEDTTDSERDDGSVSTTLSSDFARRTSTDTLNTSHSTLLRRSTASGLSLSGIDDGEQCDAVAVAVERTSPPVSSAALVDRIVVASATGAVPTVPPRCDRKSDSDAASVQELLLKQGPSQPLKQGKRKSDGELTALQLGGRATKPRRKGAMRRYKSEMQLKPAGSRPILSMDSARANSTPAPQSARESVLAIAQETVARHLSRSVSKRNSLFNFARGRSASHRSTPSDGASAKVPSASALTPGKRKQHRGRSRRGVDGSVSEDDGSEEEEGESDSDDGIFVFPVKVSRHACMFVEHDTDGTAAVPDATDAAKSKVFVFDQFDEEDEDADEEKDCFHEVGDGGRLEESDESSSETVSFEESAPRPRSRHRDGGAAKQVVDAAVDGMAAALIKAKLRRAHSKSMTQLRPRSVSTAAPDERSQQRQTSLSDLFRGRRRSVTDSVPKDKVQQAAAKGKETAPRSGAFVLSELAKDVMLESGDLTMSAAAMFGTRSSKQLLTHRSSKHLDYATEFAGSVDAEHCDSSAHDFV